MPCPNTPLRIAAIQLEVVKIPNVLLSVTDPLCNSRALNSVTIQLSNTVHSRVSATPARKRPMYNISILSERMLAAAMGWITQNTTHASRRPYRSAKNPATRAAIAAAT